MSWDALQKFGWGSLAIAADKDAPESFAAAAKLQGELFNVTTGANNARLHGGLLAGLGIEADHARSQYSGVRLQKELAKLADATVAEIRKCQHTSKRLAMDLDGLRGQGLKHLDFLTGADAVREAELRAFISQQEPSRRLEIFHEAIQSGDKRTLGAFYNAAPAFAILGGLTEQALAEGKQRILAKAAPELAANIEAHRTVAAKFEASLSDAERYVGEIVDLPQPKAGTFTEAAPQE